MDSPRGRVAATPRRCCRVTTSAEARRRNASRSNSKSYDVATDLFLTPARATRRRPSGKPPSPGAGSPPPWPFCPAQLVRFSVRVGRSARLGLSAARARVRRAFVELAHAMCSAAMRDPLGGRGLKTRVGSCVPLAAVRVCTGAAAGTWQRLETLRSRAATERPAASNRPARVRSPPAVRDASDRSLPPPTPQRRVAHSSN